MTRVSGLDLTTILTITESKTTMSEWGIDWEDMAKKAMAVDESNMPRCRDEE